MEMKKVKMVFGLLVFVVLQFSSKYVFSAPLENFKVSAVIPYTKGLESSKGLNQECNWNTYFMTRLVKYTKESAKVVEQDLATDSSRKLILSFNHSDPSLKTSKSAPLRFEIYGELQDKNQKLGDFLVSRELAKGSLQECSVLNKIADDLADDIENWMTRPSFLTSVPATLLTIKEDTISQEQKKECSTDTFIPTFLEKSRRGQVRIVKNDFGNINTRKLQLTILNARLVGGGVYSGAKWIELEGKLFEDNKLIGSFNANRWTIKGWTGCGAAERLGESLAQDILKWLPKPSMNANLGDSKPKDISIDSAKTEVNSTTESSPTMK